MGLALKVHQNGNITY